MPDRFEGHPQELAAYKAGQIDERLDNYDAHFAVVNGSIAKSADALEALVNVVVELKTKVKVASYLLGAIFSAFLSGFVYLVFH